MEPGRSAASMEPLTPSLLFAAVCEGVAWPGLRGARLGCLGEKEDAFTLLMFGDLSCPGGLSLCTLLKAHLFQSRSEGR